MEPGAGAIGATLVIPKQLLDRIQGADRLIRQLGADSNEVAGRVTKNFDDMATGANNLLEALKNLRGQFGKKYVEKISDMADAMKGVAKSTVDASTAAAVLKDNYTGAANGLSAIANNLNAANANMRRASGSASATTTSSSTASAARPMDKMDGAVKEWEAIQAEIDKTVAKQKQLLIPVREYERILDDIKKGKGGVINMNDYNAAKKLLDTNREEEAILRQMQEDVRKQISSYGTLQQLARETTQQEQYKIEMAKLAMQYKEQEIAANRKAFEDKDKLAAQEKDNLLRNNASVNAEIQRLQALKMQMSAAEYKLSPTVDTSKLSTEINNVQNLIDKLRGYINSDALKDKNGATRTFLAEEADKIKRDGELALKELKLANDKLLEEKRRNKELEYKRNTTYDGAKTFAENATTITQRTEAVKYLTVARNNLNQTTEEGRKKTAELNEMIRQLNRQNREAVEGANELKSRFSGLMNTAQQLGRQLALMFSVSSIKNYMGQIVKVRGEMELQQVALRAILQNKQQADVIFNKTKQLAVQSPFRVGQLVTYTKQLAAYRIENSKLYDTTKRLADVSAGLGIDMQRLILAYGQVKAAAYLRGTEVRQFTEAGINLYGELQKYFQEVKGEAYTTAQIVDMISKRKVAFSDIEKVFERLTDKGGIFYDMQRIQSETLYGKIEKLKDQLYLMMDNIGKANEGVIKGSVDVATVIMKNFDAVVNIGKTLAGVFLLLALYSKQAGIPISQMFSSTISKGKQAITVTSLLSTSFSRLSKHAAILGRNIKAAFMANWQIAAIMLAISAISDLISRYNDYREEIARINAESGKLKAAFNAVNDAFRSIGTGDDGKISDTQFKKKKEQLDKLKQLYQDAQLTIPVGLEDVKKETIDEFYEKMADGYKDFLKIKQALDNAFAENNARTEEWGGIFGDNIDKDAEEASAAYNAIMNKVQDLGTVYYEMYSHYDEMSDGMKKIFDDVRIQGKDQSDIDFYEARLKAVRAYAKAMDELNEKAGLFTKITWQQKYNAQFGGVLNEYKSDVKNFQDEVRDVVARTRKWYASDEDWNKNGKKLLSIEFDKKQAEKAWTEQQVQWAKEAVGIKTKIDKKETQKEIDYLADMIQRTLNDKTFKLQFATDKNFLDALYDDLDDVQKSIDNHRRNLAMINSGGKITYGYAVSKDSGFADWFKEHVLKPMGKENAYVKKDSVISKRVMTAYENWRYKNAKKVKEAYDITNKKEENAAARQEKDIWEARIDVMKKMQARYDSIRKYLDEKTASERTKEFFKEAALSTGLSEKFIKDMNLSNGGIVKAIDGLIKKPPSKATAKDLEKLKAWKAEIEMKIDEEKLKSELDHAKKLIDEKLNGYELRIKLQDLGLHDDEIKKLFPKDTTKKPFPNLSPDDILPKSYDEVMKVIKEQHGVTDEMAKLSDKELEGLMKGSEHYKAYIQERDELNKKEADKMRNTIEQLVKDYKNALTGQLEIDVWYYKERQKIEDTIKDEAMKQQMQRNLDKKYGEKTDAQSWKDFKESGMYIKVFENLDAVSTRVLTAMRGKLNDMRTSLKDLNPQEIRQIENEIQKIEDKISETHPFHNILGDAKEYLSFMTKRSELENAWLTSLKKEEAIKDDIRPYALMLEEAQNQYDKMSTEQQQSGEGQNLKADIEELQKQLLDLQKKLDAQRAESRNNETQIKKGEDASARFIKKLQESKTALSQLGSRSKDFASIWSNEVAASIGKYMDAFDGVSDGMIEILNKVPKLLDKVSDTADDAVNGVTDTAGETVKQTVGAMQATAQASGEAVKETAGTTATAIKSVERASVILAIISAALQVATAIAKLLSDESDIDERMKNEERNVKKLTRSYDKLKQAMSDAWSAHELEKNTQSAIRTQEMLIASYERQIALEQDRKNSDKDKIQDYRDSIDDARDAIKELKQTAAEELGALGTEANYKSAAQEFVDAWVDAFAEGEDALDSLNEKMNDLFKNFIKKQAMQRLANSYLEPIFKKLDSAAVDEKGQMRSVDEMLSIIGQVAQETGEAKEGLHQALLALMERFKQAGLDVQNMSNDGLSALQQGIQGITENTAEALESLLNSMRFALYEQRSDVAVIRSLLEQRLGAVEVSTDSPMLKELQNLVNIQTSIRRSIESVIAPSGGGMMLKVKGIS